MSDEPTAIGRCLTCDYELRHLPQPRCPECGREFDPHDPSTMRMTRLDHLFKEWFTAKLNGIAVIAVIIPTVFAIWIFSTPGPYYMGIVLVPLGGLVLLIMLMTWPGDDHGKVRRTTLIAVVVITGIMICFFELPLRARFMLSMPAMNRALKEAQMNPAAPRSTPRWMGLFRIAEIRPATHDTVWRFYEPETLEVGFGYSSTPVRYAGQNAGAGGHLYGGWYWFSDD